MISVAQLLQDDVVTVAPALLGWELICHSPEGPAGGIICETEAYRADDDEASHAYRGRTTRNAPMWQAGGVIYVYFSYGLHTMLNLVTGRDGAAQAVLIRALQPTVGLELMRQRRGNVPDTNLTSGPAKLTQALAVTLAMSGTKVGDPIELRPPKATIDPAAITITTRIGITKARDLPWRFHL